MTNTTESFLKWKIAETITSSETVPFTKDISKVPVLTSWYITISPDTEDEEIFHYSSVTGTIWGTGAMTFDWRWYNAQNITQDAWNNRDHTINDVMKWALNHIIINEKAEKTNLASNTNWEWASLIWIEDALWDFVGTDVEAALVELAAWAPWVADATESTAGKVELPTDAEVTSWTVAWGTWATLTPTNAQTEKSVSLKGIDATLDDADHLVFNNSWAGIDNKMLVSVFRDQLAWDKTKKGTFEMLTDAEAITWTDETRVPNIKQIDDNYLAKDLVWWDATEMLILWWTDIATWTLSSWLTWAIFVDTWIPVASYPRAIFSWWVVFSEDTTANSNRVSWTSMAFSTGEGLTWAWAATVAVAWKSYDASETANDDVNVVWGNITNLISATQFCSIWIDYQSTNWRIRLEGKEWSSWNNYALNYMANITFMKT